jgi:hypothetical protein
MPADSRLIAISYHLLVMPHSNKEISRLFDAYWVLLTFHKSPVCQQMSHTAGE